MISADESDNQAGNCTAKQSRGRVLAQRRVSNDSAYGKSEDDA